MRFVAPLRHASSVIEAAYDVGLPTDVWLKRLLRRMAVDLDGGFGLYALAIDLVGNDLAFVAPPVFHRLASEIRRIAPALTQVAPPIVAQHFRAHMVEFGSVSQLFGPAALSPVQERALPFVDSVGLSVQDGEGNGLQIVSLMPDVVRVHGRSRAAWRKLGLHLGIAWRLRRRLEHGGEPEALIERGKLVDARGKAKTRTAREALIEATRRVERARTRANASDPGQVLELWQGLVSGRWSLVDKWDSDGRRYVAAYENGETVGKVQGFAAREARVLRMHLLRATTTEIAFALGIATATVERVLSNAAKRVGLRSRTELVRLADPELATRLRLQLGCDRVDILRFDQSTLPAAWQGLLTRAQLDVATAAAGGLSDGEIARQRGTSVRTVSNLLAAVYRCLGIAGRGALVRAAVRTARRSDLPA